MTSEKSVAVLEFVGGVENTGGMRGTPDRELSMLSSLSTEDPDAVLGELDDLFSTMYSTGGRPSLQPEMLLKSTVLMAMYWMRSEQAFCERLNYDMLFKWFLDLPIEAASFAYHRNNHPNPGPSTVD